MDNCEKLKINKCLIQPLKVAGVTLHTLPLMKDVRGNLFVGEFTKDIPFVPKRYFMVTDVPIDKLRGEHAHKTCHQFLTCIKGSCLVHVDDGKMCEEIILNQANVGLYIPSKIWSVQYKYSPDAILLVFASDYYDSSDYIRDYGEFQEILNNE